jgi:hypothetical protein
VDLLVAVRADQNALLEFPLDSLPGHRGADCELLLPGVDVVELQGYRVVVAAKGALAPHEGYGSLLETRPFLGGLMVSLPALVLFAPHA